MIIERSSCGKAEGRDQVLRTARGFVLKGGTNHDRLVHPDGRWTTLGRHRAVGDGIFEQMKKQAGLK